MDTQQPYRQRLEARMIDIGERLVAAEGIAALQARRVAQEADCSVGTLYNVFGGLDGLVVAINMRTLAILGDRLQTAARGARDGTLEARLLALALAYRDFADVQRPRWRALFEHKMEPGKSVPDAYRAAQSLLFEMVEAELAVAICDPAQRSSAARALFAAVHGIVVLALDNKLGAHDAGDTELQVRFIVGAVSRGLGNDQAAA